MSIGVNNIWYAFQFVMFYLLTDDNIRDHKYNKYGRKDVEI